VSGNKLAITENTIRQNSGIQMQPIALLETSFFVKLPLKKNIKAKGRIMKIIPRLNPNPIYFIRSFLMFANVYV
jgi:hypothetical protein